MEKLKRKGGILSHIFRQTILFISPTFRYYFLGLRSLFTRSEKKKEKVEIIEE